MSVWLAAQDPSRLAVNALVASGHSYEDPAVLTKLRRPVSGCARDSLALPHLLPDEHEVLVATRHPPPATRCPACGGPHAWAVGRSEPPPGGQVARTADEMTPL